MRTRFAILPLFLLGCLAVTPPRAEASHGYGDVAFTYMADAYAYNAAARNTGYGTYATLYSYYANAYCSTAHYSDDVAGSPYWYYGYAYSYYAYLYSNANFTTLESEGISDANAYYGTIFSYYGMSYSYYAYFTDSPDDSGGGGGHG
jgi:hypothetical protein